MRVLLAGVVVGLMLVALGSKADAAMLGGFGTSPLQAQGHNGIEKAGYYRRYARRAYRRGYRRGYYGYGYPSYGYQPYGYYGYGYQPYGYYNYGWRPGVSIYIGPGWGY